MQTKIDLCNEALLKIGEKTIDSFNDDDAAAQIAGKLYDVVIDNLLCLHAWRFAIKKFELAKTEDGDFVRPSEALRIISCDNPRHDAVGDRIKSDADKIEITAVARVGAESFPAYFSAAAITKLAMEFSIPLTGNQNTFAILNALFEAELRAAKFIDSSFGANQAIADFPLITVRH